MFKIESYKRGIILSTVFNVFNKGLVFLNGIVVAYYFGAGEGTDIFFYTYNTLIILGAFTISMNSSVIIPESMRIRAEEGNERAMQFLNSFIFLYSTILLCGILLLLINPVGFFSVVSNFRTEQLIQQKTLLYLSIPLFALTCIITLLVDIMTSYKYFTISMIVGIINGAFSIILVMALHNVTGVQSVFYGFLISYAINLLLLIFLLKKQLRWRFKLGIGKIPRRIWQNLGFAQVGNLASTLAMYTPIYILSGFNAGVITALTFAQQISSLPNALITTQFSAVAGIKLNELYAEARFKDINNVFGQTANFLHFILLPISTIIFLYSAEIVDVLLGFTAIDKDTGNYISLFMKYLGLILPFHVTNTLTSRLFMASHKIKEAFWYQLIFNIVHIITIYVAVTTFGVMGYPVTQVLIYVLNTLIYYFIQRHFFKYIEYGKVLKNLFFFVLVNLVIGLVIYLGIRNSGFTDPWLILSAAFVLHAAFLLVVNHVLHMNNDILVQVKSFSSRIRQL